MERLTVLQLPPLEFQLQSCLADQNGIQSWQAYCPQRELDVIVKLAPSSALHPDQERLLWHEATTLSSLRSPRFASLLAFGRSESGLALATERLPGRSLEEVLRDGPLSVIQALKLGAAVASALEELHALGILHCDLKPAHIILDGDRVALCDFGLSRRLQSDSSPRGATFDYAAPEQLGLLREPITPASDLYALGLILRESLGEKLSRALETVELGDLARPPRCPAPLAELLFRLNRLDPHQRYTTAIGLLRDFELLQSESPSTLVLGTHDQRKTLTEPSLVGRERELILLEERLQEASGPVFLAANSGLGKSRLLETLGERARGSGLTVLQARAQVPRQGAILPLWGQLSFQLGDWLQTRQQLLKEIQVAMPERCAIVAQAFPGLSLLSPETLPASHALETLLESLFFFLERAASQQPILLVLDDVQWADAFTMRFLELPMVFTRIVAAFRTSEVEQQYALSAFSLNAIKLEPLGYEDSARLLCSMAGPLPQEAIDVIVAQAAGEPFYLQSLLRGSLETGSLCRDGETWQWIAPSQLSSDSKAGWLLSERLHLLPEDERCLLEVGAVFGQEFSLAMVVELMAAEDTMPTFDLLESARRGLVRRQGGKVVFSHDKVREALLERVSVEHSRFLHARAAEWLELHLGDSCREIALHWYQANQILRAQPYARQAAQEAQARSDFAEASTFLRVALDSCQELSLRAALLRDLALALAMSAQFEEAPSVFREALSLNREPLVRAELLAGLSEQLGRLNQLQEALDASLEGLELLGIPCPKARPQLFVESLGLLIRLGFGRIFPDVREPTSIELARVRLCELILEPVARLERMDYFGWSLLRGLWEIRDAKPRPEGCRLLTFVGFVFAGLKFQDWANLAKNRALEGAQLHPRVRAHTTGQSGLTLLMTGDIAKAMVCLQEAVALCRTYRDGWNLEVCQHHWALCAYFLGQFRSAEDAVEKLLPGPYQGDCSNPVAAAKVLALLGKGQEWRTQIELYKDKLQGSMFRCLAPFVIGLWELKASCFVESIKQFRYASECHSPLIGPHTASASAWLATALRMQAECLPAEATSARKGLLRQAERAVVLSHRQTKSFPVNQPHYLREYALSSAHAGRFFLSRSLFEKAFALSEKLGMLFESAWTLYERGRFAKAAGWTDWEADLTEGLARARRLGGWIPGVDLDPPQAERHLAKLDRFDRVLESGRRLVALESEPELLETFQREAKALLRCDKVDYFVHGHHPHSEWSSTLLEKCLTENRAVSEADVEDTSRSLLLHEARSTLMAPLRVEGQHHGVLVAWQKSIGGFFGEEETRLADYLCALAGAGLENARILAQRQRTFQALQTSEERFRGFFDYAGVGTALLDDSGVILQENPYLRTLLGGSSLGKTPWQLAHATDREEFKAGFATLHAELSHRYDSEVRLHRSGGEVAWTQSCLVALPVRDGDESRYLLTVADTTHRRIAEMMEFLENERRSLAAEVHDELAQDLAALHMLWAGLKSEDSGVQRATEMARKLVDNTTNLMASLRNPLAEGVDLLAALKSLVANFSVECEAEVEVRWPEQALPLSDLAALVLYRVLQEGLTNIRKHAQATSVLLCFRLLPGHLEVTLKDNGCGFDASVWLDRRSVGRHFGLLSMRDRTEMVGGHLQVLASDDGGCTLLATLPCQQVCLDQGTDRHG